MIIPGIHHFAIVFEESSIAFNSILSFQHNHVVFQQLCKMFQQWQNYSTMENNSIFEQNIQQLQKAI